MKTTITTPMRSVRLAVALALATICSSVSFAQLSNAVNAVKLKTPIYFGYEIGIGIQRYAIKSTISRINNLTVLREGAHAGVKLSNKRAALRANAGLYYSDASIGYSIDHLEGTVSGNLYLLRLGKAQPHTFEPYAVAGISYQRAKFFGSYLDNEKKNYSSSEEPELGSVRWYGGEIGGGVEFQMHNDNLDFLHFFAEAKYGIPLTYSSSNEIFSQTYVNAPVAFTLGVTFGRIR